LAEYKKNAFFTQEISKKNDKKVCLFCKICYKNKKLIIGAKNGEKPT
jgi:hypothetical protein